MPSFTHEIVWTFLPNGRSADGTKLAGSIVASPRLKSDSAAGSKLGEFPIWIDWPRALQSAVFTLGGVNGQPLARVSAPDSGIWKSLFSSDTPVTPWIQQSYSDKTVLSYPVAAMEKTLDAIYGDLAVAADGKLPRRASFKTLARPFTQRRSPETIIEGLVNKKKGQEVPGRTLPTPSVKAATGGLAANISPALVEALDLLAAYHRPLNAQAETSANDGDTGETYRFRKATHPALPKVSTYVKQIDFHQIAASLTQYPDLARLCGLVLDVEFDESQAPAGSDMTLTVDWQSKIKPKAPTPITPTSRVSRANGRFIMQPFAQTGPLIDRFLKLRGGPVELVQMDVDGAGLKFSQFNDSMLRDVDVDFDDDTETPKDNAAEVGAPSLRTAGLMLAYTRRDQALTAQFARADVLNASGAPLLFADDAIKGYRVDVRDDVDPVWRTLCARHGRYTFLDKSGARTFGSTDKLTPNKRPASEGMARVAAGGSTDGANPNVIKVHEGLFGWRGWSLCAPEPGLWIDKDNSARKAADPLPAGLPLKVDTFAQPGSLPSLRFGRKYEMRVRLVDLAGNSEPYRPGDLQPSAATTVPTAFLRYEPVEAPALALVRGPDGVERPSDGESMGRMAIRTLDASPPGQVRRHVLPPRVSVKFAELHGVLDKGGRIDPSWYPVLAGQDAALQTDPPAVFDSHGVEILPDTHTVANTPYAFGDEDLVLPYLPDPLAFGVAIRVEGVEGLDPGVVHRVPLYGLSTRWPKAKPFQIILSSGHAAFTIDPGPVVRIRLERADKAKLRISCILPKSAASILKINALMTQRAPATKAAGLKALMDSSQHWMMTPWRTLELVHAVQRPLIKPAIETADVVHRPLGERTTEIGFITPLSAKSTGRIDLEAQWNEANDTKPEGPSAQLIDSHAWHQTVARDAAPSNRLTVRQAGHTFPDTRYRRVQYRLDASTRFREFMDATIRAKPCLQTRTSETKQIWVPNSAAPPPPQVVYVVPTFGWSQSASGGETRSWRAGGGLRVYLDRPWFASGFGEMLGVVLAQPGVGASLLDGPLKTLATQWGRDPLWPNDPIKTVAPSLKAFPLAHYAGPIPINGIDGMVEEGVALPPGPFPQKLPHPGVPATTETLKLNVAPHAVAYDAERKLWYADIVIDAPSGAYFPFIRLALARYHPVSENGAHLSDVVLTEFQQLTPDRLAVVTHPPLGMEAKVVIHGALPIDARAQTPFAGLFEISLQTLTATGDPDLDWRDIPKPTMSKKPIDLTPFDDQTSGASGGLRAGDLRVNAAANPQLRAQGEALAAQGRFREILADTRLLQVMAPPVIHEETIGLVAPPPGGRRRLLITESEVFEAQPGAPSPWGSRIVYAEAIDV